MIQGDCAPPESTDIQGALEFSFLLNESLAIMEEGSAERAAFIEAFKIDMGRSLNIPPTSIVVTGIFVVDDDGRRRLEGEEEENDHSPQVPLADLHDTARRSLQRGRRPVVVVVERATLVVEFKIMEVVNALAARAIVDDLALQGSDPTSALRTANVTGKVTRVDTVRMDEPSSWVADLNDAIVAASCEGQQLLVTVTYGNTAWSLTRFPDTAPLLSGETDLVEEYYCVPDGIYSMALWPSSTLVSPHPSSDLLLPEHKSVCSSVPVRVTTAVTVATCQTVRSLAVAILRLARLRADRGFGAGILLQRRLDHQAQGHPTGSGRRRRVHTAQHHCLHRRRRRRAARLRGAPVR